MFSPTCFGRFAGHIQADVIITRIWNVQIWLNVSPLPYQIGFIGFSYIMDLMNACKMEHMKTVRCFVSS